MVHTHESSHGKNNCPNNYRITEKSTCKTTSAFFMVGVTRIELATSWTPFKRATKLRYTPITDHNSRLAKKIISQKICKSNSNSIVFLFFYQKGLSNAANCDKIANDVSGGIAQSVRAHASHAWGRWFKSNYLHQRKKYAVSAAYFFSIRKLTTKGQKASQFARAEHTPQNLNGRSNSTDPSVETTTKKRKNSFICR